MYTILLHSMAIGLDLAIALTGLISYAAYQLCTHIPAIDLASTGVIQIFG